MDSSAAALIGMGMAAVGFAGSGIGIGYIFGKMIESVARQPEAEAKVGKYMWIGFALVEAIALYGLVIAFIIMGMKGGEG
ncbi:MAG: ATP synthase F0 subunit C [Candidatus Scalinduaceae bacterium]